jgi:inorganic phosphate transporter, PiT family
MELTLLLIALVLGFYMAWNIGANDVANAMGTSVGSGALTLLQAVLIAAVLEFAGALLVGGHVSETIESGVVNPALFSPTEYIYGMLASLLAAGVWLQFASYHGWPVSTTHSIVGALIGFGIIAGGFSTVYWGQVGYVLSAWIASPIIGGAIAFLLFNFIRRRILDVAEPVNAAKRLTPLFVFALITVLVMMMLFNGLKSFHLNFGFWQALGISSGVGLIAAIIAKLLVRRIQLPEKSKEGYHRLRREYRMVEGIFVFLQIMSASFMAFAHGANDVANAIGPLSGVVSMIRNGVVVHRDHVPIWILALGGVGIVVGLATWGYRVIRTIGKKITELTPTRGFSAEFGAAITIIVCSRLGLPISTTHTLVGGVLGVGLARGIGAINLNIIRDIALSWVVTVPAGAILSILFYKLFTLIPMAS